MGQIWSVLGHMSSGLDEIKRNARERMDQDAYIARLQLENCQLRNKNEQLELQQRSSGATRLLDRSVVSLPSFATQVISSSPIGDFSVDDLDKSLSPPEPRIRGKFVGEFLYILIFSSKFSCHLL